MAPAQSIRSQKSGVPVFKAAAKRFRSALRPSPDAVHRRQAAMALRELATFEDHRLNDIGLRRSDILPQWLEAAGTRRRFRQAMIKREATARQPDYRTTA